MKHLEAMRQNIIELQKRLEDKDYEPDASDLWLCMELGYNASCSTVYHRETAPLVQKEFERLSEWLKRMVG